MADTASSIDQSNRIPRARWLRFLLFLVILFVLALFNLPSSHQAFLGTAIGTVSAFEEATITPVLPNDIECVIAGFPKRFLYEVRIQDEDLEIRRWFSWSAFMANLLIAGVLVVPTAYQAWNCKPTQGLRLTLMDLMVASLLICLFVAWFAERQAIYTTEFGKRLSTQRTPWIGNIRGWKSDTNIAEGLFGDWASKTMVNADYDRNDLPQNCSEHLSRTPLPLLIESITLRSTGSPRLDAPSMPNGKLRQLELQQNNAPPESKQLLQETYPMLRSVVIVNGELDESFLQWIKRQPNLRILHLRNCICSSLPPDFFESLPHLQYFGYSSVPGVPEADLRGIEKCSQLRSLVVSESIFKTISPELNQLRNLRELIVQPMPKREANEKPFRRSPFETPSIKEIPPSEREQWFRNLPSFELADLPAFKRLILPTHSLNSLKLSQLPKLAEVRWDRQQDDEFVVVNAASDIKECPSLEMNLAFVFREGANHNIDRLTPKSNFLLLMDKRPLAESHPDQEQKETAPSSVANDITRFLSNLNRDATGASLIFGFQLDSQMLNAIPNYLDRLNDVTSKIGLLPYELRSIAQLGSAGLHSADSMIDLKMFRREQMAELSEFDWTISSVFNLDRMVQHAPKLRKLSVATNSHSEFIVNAPSLEQLWIASSNYIVKPSQFAAAASVPQSPPILVSVARCPKLIDVLLLLVDGSHLELYDLPSLDKLPHRTNMTFSLSKLPKLRSASISKDELCGDVTSALASSNRLDTLTLSGEFPLQDLLSVCEKSSLRDLELQERRVRLADHMELTQGGKRTVRWIMCEVDAATYLRLLFDDPDVFGNTRSGYAIAKNINVLAASESDQWQAGFQPNVKESKPLLLLSHAQLSDEAAEWIGGKVQVKNLQLELVQGNWYPVLNALAPNGEQLFIYNDDLETPAAIAALAKIPNSIKIHTVKPVPQEIKLQLSQHQFLQLSPGPQ